MPDSIPSTDPIDPANHANFDMSPDEIDWTGQVLGEFRVLHRLGRADVCIPRSIRVYRHRYRTRDGLVNHASATICLLSEDGSGRAEALPRDFRAVVDLNL